MTSTSVPTRVLRCRPCLKKRPCCPGGRAVLCRARHPLANATSLKQLVRAEWITTSITLRAGNRNRRSVQTLRVAGADVGTAEPIGAHAAHLPGEHRSARHGSRAMGGTAICRSRDHNDPSDGRVVSGVHYCCHAIGVAFGASRCVPVRPYETGRRPSRPPRAGSFCRSHSSCELARRSQVLTSLAPASVRAPIDTVL